MSEGSSILIQSNKTVNVPQQLHILYVYPDGDIIVSCAATVEPKGPVHIYVMAPQPHVSLELLATVEHCDIVEAFHQKGRNWLFLTVRIQRDTVTGYNTYVAEKCDRLVRLSNLELVRQSAVLPQCFFLAEQTRRWSIHFLCYCERHIQRFVISSKGKERAEYLKTSAGDRIVFDWCHVAKVRQCVYITTLKCTRDDEWVVNVYRENDTVDPLLVHRAKVGIDMPTSRQLLERISEVRRQPEALCGTALPFQVLHNTDSLTVTDGPVENIFVCWATAREDVEGQHHQVATVCSMASGQKVTAWFRQDGLESNAVFMLVGQTILCAFCGVSRWHCFSASAFPTYLRCFDVPGVVGVDMGVTHSTVGATRRCSIQRRVDDRPTKMTCVHTETVTFDADVLSNDIRHNVRVIFASEALPSPSKSIVAHLEKKIGLATAPVLLELATEHIRTTLQHSDHQQHRRLARVLVKDMTSSGRWVPQGRASSSAVSWVVHTMHDMESRVLCGDRMSCEGAQILASCCDVTPTTQSPPRDAKDIFFGLLIQSKLCSDTSAAASLAQSAATALDNIVLVLQTVIERSTQPDEERLLACEGLIRMLEMCACEVPPAVVATSMELSRRVRSGATYALRELDIATSSSPSRLVGGVSPQESSLSPYRKSVAMLAATVPTGCPLALTNTAFVTAMMSP
eukprot:PhM_4_TR8386/c0_g1_i1/m.74198